MSCDDEVADECEDDEALLEDGEDDGLGDDNLEEDDSEDDDLGDGNGDDVPWDYVAERHGDRRPPRAVEWPRTAEELREWLRERGIDDGEFL